MKTLKFAILALTGLFALVAGPAVAEKTVITDVTGRKVELDLPAKRVLLGEARQVHVIAALKGDKTFETIVGWRDDLVKKDADTYVSYRDRFPDIEKLPRFGYVGNGTFNLEAAIALKPDLLTLNLESVKAAEEASLVEKAAAAGIAVVYLDFRVDPEKNTENSIALLGEIFGAEEKAKALTDYRRAQIARVTDRLAAAKPAFPKVFIERSPGISGDVACCRTFGPVNFGRMVELGGGHNIGSDVTTGTFGDLNPEQLVVANPDHVIVTGANWAAESDIKQFVNVGPGADPEAARQKLADLMQRPAFPGLKAVKQNQVHAVWHQFYGNPYDFVAIQQFAKWFHPELFADLDPEETFRDFHQKFLPVIYRTGYFVSVEAGDM
ncbi:ABC transporter substrate-binding protein [Pararhizobium sp. LjRoot235]|uniref:ABC transporter substrate-binding protein n=1 Tax=Pararhizobium sp. LjRoot235 TaxID=3342291 RepID=UPI003ED0BE75